MTINGKNHYLQNIKKEDEEKLERLITYLRDCNLLFYTLTERNEGNNRYVDVCIKIKIA